MLLEHHDLVARLAQHRRAAQAAQARADDDDVGLGRRLELLRAPAPLELVGVDAPPRGIAGLLALEQQAAEIQHERHREGNGEQGG